MAIVETIRYEGPEDALIWRSTGKEYMLNGDEGINAGSRLIVDAFYEAILFANGMALDTFTEGAHTLITQNIPLLKAQYEKMTEKTPFPCKVYFINKVDQFALNWGTQSSVEVHDLVYQMLFNISARGNMSIRISDSRRFLLKFVGNKSVFTKEDLVFNLRSEISARVKQYISKIMNVGKVSYFTVNVHAYDIGQMIKGLMEPIFEEYGIELITFNVEAIEAPPEQYSRLQDSLQTEAARRAEGYTWDTQRRFEVAEALATNLPSMVPTMGGMGMVGGMPMSGITNVLETVTDSVFGGSGNGGQQTIPSDSNTRSVYAGDRGENADLSGLFGGSKKQNTLPCPKCGADVDASAKFCGQCGEQMHKVQHCVACGKEIPAGSAFCNFCGSPQAQPVCPTCGADVAAGSNFCNRCGTRVKP